MIQELGCVQHSITVRVAVQPLVVVPSHLPALSFSLTFSLLFFLCFWLLESLKHIRTARALDLENGPFID